MLDFVAPVSRFLTTELLRQDYLIIDDNGPPSADNRGPGSLKEQRLQQLCTLAGYRSQLECNQVQRSLLCAPRPQTAQAFTVLLIESYLPQCIGLVDTEADPCRTDRALCSPLVISELLVENERYRLALTPEIHALMVDNSGALLAA